LEYGSEIIPEEREFLLKISPALRAHEIVSPLYLGQGENDSRVPLNEAIQMAHVVQGNGVPVWMVVGRKEGHVFTQKSVQDISSYAMAAFMHKFL
jgi:dipeptidyl aminopeptidase/acylaminoacyl peptidase